MAGAINISGQTVSRDLLGNALAYGARDVAAGATVVICALVAARDTSLVELNLSFPASADWATSSFSLLLEDTEIVPIIDETARFIDRPWSIPVNIRSGYTVKVAVTNGGSTTLRCSAYLGLRALVQGV